MPRSRRLPFNTTPPFGLRTWILGDFRKSDPEYFKKRLPVDASPALNVHDKRVKAAFAMEPGAMKGFGFDKTGLKQLRIPTYLIAGAGDTVVPIKENAGFVAKYAPKAKLRIIPGPVGHEIFLNECDEEGKAEFPEACRDDPSVDRAKVHKLIQMRH